MKTNKINARKFALPSVALVLLAVLIYTYGFGFEQTNNLAANYGLIGSISCLQQQGFVLPWGYCHLVSLPIGLPFVTGLPVIYTAYVLTKVFFLSPHVAYHVVSLGILAASLWGCFKLFSFFATRWAALFGAFLYLISFTIFGQSSFGTTMHGFILLPLFLFIDCAFYVHLLKNGSTKRWRIVALLLFAAVIFTKSTSIFLDGYSFVMYSLASGLLLAVFCWRHRRRWTRLALLLGGYCSASAIAYFLYSKYVPGGGEFSVMPIDFFRGQGIDLVSLVLPRMGLWISDVLGYATRWDPYAFYGDGSNVNFSFLGYTTVVFIGLCLLFIRARKNVLLIGLIITASAAFLLSLGPSLKINDQRPAEQYRTGVPRFDDYLMPADAATINLHTDFIYQSVPGIKNMRQVSRWIVLVKLCLAGVAAFVTSMLWTKKYKFAAVLLVSLALIEMSPNYPKLFQKYASAHDQLDSFNATAVSELKTLTNPGETVFFLSTENDYLGKYLAIAAGTPTYTTSGDKNIEIVAPHWPQEIKELRKNQNVSENLKRIIDNGTVNAVIVPFFSLRAGSYNWPPSAQEVAKKKENASELASSGDLELSYQEGDWFGVLRKKD